jgi:hypothetical protein
MISPIHSVTPAQPAAQVTAAQPTTSKATAQPAAVDTVQISSAAKTLSQENLETAAQTAHEASSGDVQAQRLLARHAAARTSAK